MRPIDREHEYRQLHAMTPEERREAWNYYRAMQREERLGMRQVQPSRTDSAQREHRRAEVRAARRRTHKARRSRRLTPEHHAARVSTRS